MKWDNDPYHMLKWRIFDDIKDSLYDEDSKKVTMKTLMDAIDDMFVFMLNKEKL